MMKTRLAVTPFDLTCLVPGGQAEAHLPEAWPGDALAMYTGELKRMGPQETEVAGLFCRSRFGQSHRGGPTGGDRQLEWRRDPRDRLRHQP